MSRHKPKPVHRWSTNDVPEAKRRDYFLGVLSEAVYPLGVDRVDARTFHANVVSAQFGGVSVCKTIGAPHRAFHGRTDAWLRQWIPNPYVRRIDGGSLWGLALSYLNELSLKLAADPPLPLSVIADQVGSLLALTAKALQCGTVTSSPTLRSLQERIRDHIVQRCMETELTAGDVAAALSISVRTLHRSFADARETFGGFLIDAPARVAIRMLASPLFRRVTTAEISRRAGFLSASHFARVVRSRIGRTPMQLRRAFSRARWRTRPSATQPFETLRRIVAVENRVAANFRVTECLTSRPSEN